MEDPKDLVATESATESTSSKSTSPAYTAASDLQAHNFGRKEQLQRNFSIWSLIGAAFVGMPTWSVIVTSLNLGVYQGGMCSLVLYYQRLESVALTIAGPALIIYGP